MSIVLICPGEARCLVCIRDETRGLRERDTQEMRNALFNSDMDICAHVLKFNEGHKTQI